MTAKTLSLLPVIALLLGLWALVPGMHGSFLFDDFVNLNALGQYGPVRDFSTLALFLTSTHGDPLGRPLALLSFLLDAQDWPAPPYPFLRTNVLLHLLNGQLLTMVMLRVSRARGQVGPRTFCAAVLGACIWLLHPLLLSTTLYVVQREAMLAASFVLLGILAWLKGRVLLQNGALRSGWALLLAGSLGCTTLAILCKANGVLLPALLLVTEVTVLPVPAIGSERALNLARRLLLVVPVIVVLAALLFILPEAIERAAQLRPWTLNQRLLSEPRVLLDYLRLLLLPRATGHSLFHDDFLASTGLLHPVTTLPSMAVVLALVVGAWRLRKRLPELSFAVLFFFVAHALEGSVIPLELYFEHRNYLPAMPLFWPLACWLTAPGSLARLRYAAAAMIPALLAIVTHSGAQLWSQPKQLALVWALNSPDSPRAQAYAAQWEMSDGEFAAAHRRLQIALAHNPNEAQLAINLVNAECGLNGLHASTLQTVEQAIATSKNAAQLSFTWLSAAVNRARNGDCAGLDLSAVTRLTHAMRSNHYFAQAPGRIQDVEHIQGLLFLATGEGPQSLASFNRALDALPRPEIAMHQAALLAGKGRPDLARCHLDRLSRYSEPRAHPWPDMQHIHLWLLQRRDYWLQEEKNLRAQLDHDMQDAQRSQGQTSIDCEHPE